MKIIVSEEYLKLGKSKYPKSETEPYNPWAVCNKSTGGKKEEPEKFERCVQHIKSKNRKKNKKKDCGPGDMKSSRPGFVHTQEIEKKEDEEGKYVKQKGQYFRHNLPRENIPGGNVPENEDYEWEKVLKKIKDQAEEDRASKTQSYSGKRIIIEAKKKK